MIPQIVFAHSYSPAYCMALSVFEWFSLLLLSLSFCLSPLLCPSVCLPIVLSACRSVSLSYLFCFDPFIIFLHQSNPILYLSRNPYFFFFFFRTKHNHNLLSTDHPFLFPFLFPSSPSSSFLSSSLFTPFFFPYLLLPPPPSLLSSLLYPTVIVAAPWLYHRYKSRSSLESRAFITFILTLTKYASVVLHSPFALVVLIPSAHISHLHATLHPFVKEAASQTPSAPIPFFVLCSSLSTVLSSVLSFGRHERSDPALQTCEARIRPHSI